MRRGVSDCFATVVAPLVLATTGDVREQSSSRAKNVFHRRVHDWSTGVTTEERTYDAYAYTHACPTAVHLYVYVCGEGVACAPLHVSFN